LTTVEQFRLPDSWNATDAPYPDDACIHQLFEAQAACTPEAVALLHGDERLTFDALNRRANRLARYLRRLGVGPGTLVGLYMERSAGAVVALFAILKAGGAYLPLDPTYPPERIAFMVEDAAPAVLLTHADLAADAPPHTRRVVVDGADQAAIAAEGDENLDSGAIAGDTAYVIYTSGSTGHPKGVAAPHRAAINRFHWMWQAYPFAPGEVCCQKTALSFVDSVWEIFGPLLRGVPVVVIPDEVLTDPPRFVEALAEAGVTRLVLVPSLLRLLLHAAPDLRERAPRLTFWVSSGEALPAGLCRRFRELLPGCTLLNLYGSSEVAADATCYDTCDWDGAAAVPIGRPIANTRVYILDEARRQVPLGAVGELYIGGAGLAHGYLGRPDLTAERFVPDPFAGDPAARLYKTGDLARYRPDGVVEYHGRDDHQVKIRGRRIELGEIEAALAGHPCVREAVVVARDDGTGDPDDRRIVAYVVPNNPHDLTTADLRDYLAARLPTYMVPAAVTPLEALPLTPNGKVDRQALPAPGIETISDRPIVAPAGPVEERLVKLWQDLLQVAPIGVTDNFFALGAHSLLAVRLIDEIERAFGKRIPLAILFEDPTVARLAAALQEQGSDIDLTGLVTVQAAGSHSARQPLYFVHGDFWGGGFYCLNLSRHLGADQPFYAFEQHGLHDEDVPATIEEMAAHHVRTLRAHRPHGPYLLGGHCSAGLIAFEMARQLEGQGHEVALVALVHTAVESAHYAAARRVVERIGGLARLDAGKQARLAVALGGCLRRLDRLARMDRAERAGAARRSLRRATQRLPIATPHNGEQDETRVAPVENGTHETSMPDDAPEQRLEARRRRVNAAYIHANRAYVPGAYSGPVALFVAREESDDYRRDRTLGWRRCTRGALDIQVVPGDHVTCVTDDTNVQAVARALRARLDRAQPRPL